MIKEKIAVYGDSFAVHNKDLKWQSWLSYLEKEYDIDFYGADASNLFYSYKNFMENYKKYNKNIFIFTSTDRVSTSRHHFGGLVSQKYWLNNDRPDYTDNDKRDARRIYSYMSSVLTDDFVKEQYDTYHILMTERILNTNTNVLLIPAFPQPGNNFKNYKTLIDIYGMENRFWKRTRNFHDLRQCHLTEENNKVLADQINQELITVNGPTKIKLDLSMYVEPTDLEKYRIEK